MARTPKLDHVKAKALARGDVHEIGTAYLSRLYPIVYHMHQVLHLHAGDNASLQTAKHQYVIALATHLETFFRDIFRYALENHQRLFDDVVRKHHLRIPSEPDLAARHVTRYDFVAESLTLQSATSIADALDPLFQPDGFRLAVERTQIEYAVPSRSALSRGFPTTAFPNWWEDFSTLFDLRHEFVHDANSTSIVSTSDVARLESLAVVLPQYVTMMIGAVRLVLLVPDSRHAAVMLLVEDLLATDWEVVAEP